ncbi:hypothetical protein N658DRAFT_534411 [Parathielavia hyrcaniae]|uniref:Uncharacterized protein n=1 Tax=Parathielavia hyrcaniae TaxID=113614 RepID=A0AAN6PQG6_9PEZI|nr:hypothetical protein N658DRAFT_534411 [Parathielavia hyrcaniae]
MFRDIASDFDTYSLRLISSQPLYRKLNNIYSRKPLLLIAYVYYCGLLLGRFMYGTRNMGITVLISTLIVGYVYAIIHIGRVVGPSIDGLLADGADWRWALLFQRDMSFPPPPMPKSCSDPITEDYRLSKLRRVDFSSSTTLALANSSPGSFGRDLSSVIPISTWLSFLVVFLVVEALWAREPIIPLRLLTERNVMSLYGIQLYTSAPLYFRETVNDSTTRVAIRLLVISFGTVIGGLVSRFAIKHYVKNARIAGRYRLVTIISILISNISFLAVFFRWCGPTGWALRLPHRSGPAKVAVGTLGFYLSLNLGALFGVSAASTLITTFVERALRKALSVFSLVFGCPALVASLIMRGGNLDEKKSCRRKRSRSHPGSTYYTFGSSESREA